MQDPAERVYSSWKMLHRTLCSGPGVNASAAACPVPSLAALAKDVLPDSPLPPECLFYSPVRVPGGLPANYHLFVATRY